MTSKAWEYFTRKGKFAICKRCSTNVPFKGGSTSGLWSHLKNKHEIKKSYYSESLTTSITTPENTSGILSFIRVNKKTEKSKDFLCKLICESNFSINAVVNSSTLQELFITSGLSKIPSSRTMVTNMIKIKAKLKKELIIEKIKKEKENGIRYSLLIDEWTSIAQKRFMAIIISSEKEFLHLGLVRIRGKFTSDNCYILLKEKLEEFSLNLETDIVLIISDGCAMMVKVGRIFDGIHIICMAHTIHLAVSDTLYSIKNNIPFNEEINKNLKNESLYLNHPEHESEKNESEDSEEEIETKYKYEDIGNLISKIRRIVKIFKWSPLKQEFLIEKKLVLDIKTRWNSLVSMFRSFRSNINEIRKSLLEFKISEEFSFKDEDLLNKIIILLEPIEYLVKKLCCNKNNLKDSLNVFDFVMNKLRELELQNHYLASSLVENLTKRVNFRSNRKLIECLEFLENNEAKYDYEFIIKNIIRLTEGSKKNYKDTLTSSDPTYESQKFFKYCL